MGSFYLLEIGGFFNSISPDAWIMSFGTVIGAFLGAFFAGKYALKSVQKQFQFQKGLDSMDLEIQSIKFEDAYERIFNLLELYGETFKGTIDPTAQDVEHYDGNTKIEIEDIPERFKNRLEEIRAYSLTLKMDRTYEVLLIAFLNQANEMYVLIVRWDPYQLVDNQEGIKEWDVHSLKLKQIKQQMVTHIEELKRKHYEQ